MGNIYEPSQSVTRLWASRTGWDSSLKLWNIPDRSLKSSDFSQQSGYGTYCVSRSSKHKHLQCTYMTYLLIFAIQNLGSELKPFLSFAGRRKSKYFAHFWSIFLELSNSQFSYIFLEIMAVPIVRNENNYRIICLFGDLLGLWCHLTHVWIQFLKEVSWSSEVKWIVLHYCTSITNNSKSCCALRQPINDLHILVLLLLLLVSLI